MANAHGNGGNVVPARVPPNIGTFWQGLVVALLTLAAAFLMHWMQMPWNIVVAMLVLTISAFLYCLGTVAKVASPGYVIMGAGAVFIITYPYYLYQTKNSYAYVKLSGVGRSNVEVHSGTTRILGAPNLYDDSYDFIVLEQTLNARIFSIRVVRESGDRFNSDCVPIDKLRGIVGLGLQEAWQLDWGKKEIVDSQGHTVAKEECRRVPVASTGISLVTPANAAEIGNSVRTPNLIQDLQSTVPDVRAAARVELVKAGKDSIEPLMVLFRAQDTSSGLVFDILTIFNQSISVNPSLSAVFDAKLTNEDIRRILALAKSDDRSLRVQAVEFLASQFSSKVFHESAAAAKQSTLGSRDAYNYSYVAAENARAALKADRARQLDTFKEIANSDARVKAFVNKIAE